MTLRVFLKSGQHFDITCDEQAAESIVSGIDQAAITGNFLCVNDASKIRMWIAPKEVEAVVTFPTSDYYGKPKP